LWLTGCIDENTQFLYYLTLPSSAAELSESRGNISSLSDSGHWPGYSIEPKSGGPMSASIRLKRFGTKKRTYYRIVVIDKKAPRDGKIIEEVGYYHPIEAEDKQIVFDAEKVRVWLDKGAIVSDTVRSILNKKNFYLN
jgi:small subunit ribosomal protein S16